MYHQKSYNLARIVAPHGGVTRGRCCSCGQIPVDGCSKIRDGDRCQHVLTYLSLTHTRDYHDL